MDLSFLDESMLSDNEIGYANEEKNSADATRMEALVLPKPWMVRGDRRAWRR